MLGKLHCLLACVFASHCAAGKAVFNIQYTDSNSTFQSTICPYTTQYGLTSIRKAADQALNARPWDTCALGLPPTPPPSTPPVSGVHHIGMPWVTRPGTAYC
jgi:hypothetical protein